MAEQPHEQITPGPEPALAIYTDGSGINEKVGASVMAPALNIYAQAYLGKETTTTVHAAELISMLMGVKIAIKSN